MTKPQFVYVIYIKAAPDAIFVGAGADGRDREGGDAKRRWFGAHPKDENCPDHHREGDPGQTKPWRKPVDFAFEHRHSRPNATPTANALQRDRP